LTEIKPLKWLRKPPPAHSLDDEDAEGAVYAMSFGGCFKLTKDALLWTAEDPFVWKQFKTVQEAKAFAQAEHERMIRACLVPERSDLAPYQERINELTRMLTAAERAAADLDAKLTDQFKQKLIAEAQRDAALAALREIATRNRSRDQLQEMARAALGSSHAVLDPENGAASHD
jgi:hypothetical protein